MTLTTLPSPAKRGYGLRLVHYTSYGPAAVIALERGTYRSTRAALRDHRRDSYRVRRTRLRGRRGFLLTRKARPSVLLWREDGSVYTLASGTPKKVSVRGMRATAAALDHLGANYIGSYFAEGSDNTSLDATLVTTQHFITGFIEWGTDNCAFNGVPSAAHGGSANFFMLPLRRGNTFSLPLTEGWNGSLSGTVSAPAVNVALQGSGTFDQEACDTGPMSVSADRRDPG